MRRILKASPRAIGFMLVVIIFTSMFFSDPVIRVICLLSGILTAALIGEIKNPLGEFAFYTLLIATVAVTNPLFVHRGETVLFLINGKHFTLESLLYGVNSSIALVGSLIWFRIFSSIMTAEKLSSLFCTNFASLSTLLTLTLRYVPTFKKRFSEISEAQKAAGFLSGNTAFQRLKARLNIFFSLAESSLEMSVRTADSMRARGFMLGKKTNILKKTLQPLDICITAMALVTTVFLIFLTFTNRLVCEFYPRIYIKSEPIIYIFYLTICNIITIFEIRERLKWRSSNAKI